MESSLVEILVQGGAIGVALVSLWIIWKLVTNHDRHLLDVVDRNTDAHIRVAEILQKLADKIDFLIK